MKRIALLVVSFIFTIGISTLVFGSAPTSIDENQYKVAWSDEFEGEALDTTIWSYQLGNGGYSNWEWGNNEKEFYKKKNASVSDGTLKINAKYEQNAGKMDQTVYNFSSARIITKDKVSIGYGYLEAKIKIPSAKGIWPAFWTMGTNGKVWPRCGEIDIMEAFNTDNRIQQTIHFPRISDENDLCNYYTNYSSDKTQWHTYGCYRDGNVVAFYIDRQQILYYSTEDGEYSCWQNYPWEAGTWEGRRSVLNDDQFILLNVACGGNLPRVEPDNTLDVNMEVDYVRHYVYDSSPETTTQTQTTTWAPITTVAPVTTTATPSTTVAPTTTVTPTTTVPTTVTPVTATPTKVTPSQKTTTVSKPTKTTIKKLKNIKKKKLVVTLKKVKGVTGYQVRWCDNKKFDGYEQKNTKKPKVTLKSLSKNTKYWIKARAYKAVKGVKTYGKWSAKKSVKVKK